MERKTKETIIIVFNTELYRIFLVFMEKNSEVVSKICNFMDLEVGGHAWGREVGT